MWETKNFFLITAAEDSSSRDRRNTSKIPRREINQNCISVLSYKREADDNFDKRLYHAEDTLV